MAPLTHPAELSEALGIPFSAQQLAAITAPLEPSVIIAGAGSGKTTVMAARVVWLVGTGQVRPEQVLGLTFTRKAAAELSGRVRAALAGAGVVDATGDDDAGEQVIMTYDAFASRLVADHGLRIGVEGDARMLTGASRFRMASKVVSRAPGPWAELARLRPDSVTDKVLTLDAELSSHLVAPERLLDHAFTVIGGVESSPRSRTKDLYASMKRAAAIAAERAELSGLVEDYQRLKREMGAVEFADQMGVAADLARRVPDVSRALRVPVPGRPARRIPRHLQRAGSAALRAVLRGTTR
jgi:DNA helicase-2/ATP-dependent DNA helicase PcrA